MRIRSSDGTSRETEMTAVAPEDQARRPRGAGALFRQEGHE